MHTNKDVTEARGTENKALSNMSWEVVLKEDEKTKWLPKRDGQVILIHLYSVQ